MIRIRNYLNRFIVGLIGYIAYMVYVDVPSYMNFYLNDQVEGKIYTDFAQGFENVKNCALITKHWSEWWTQARWQTPYFTMGVWISLAMAYGPYMMRLKDNNGVERECIKKLK